MYEYSLWLHYKQGDDFRDLLEKNNDNVAKALSEWAEEFEEKAEHCRKLAAELEGKEVEVQADTHHIGFEGDEKLLNELAKKNLLERQEIEEEEEVREG